VRKVKISRPSARGTENIEADSSRTGETCGLKVKLAKDLIVVKLVEYEKYIRILYVSIKIKRFSDGVIAVTVMAGHEESNIEGFGEIRGSGSDTNGFPQRGQRRGSRPVRTDNSVDQSRGVGGVSDDTGG